MELIAIDIGYGLTKGLRGERIEMFPSLIAKQDDHGLAPGGAELEFDGQHYLLGESARLNPLHWGTLHGSRSSSLEYRLMAMGMLGMLIPERRMTVKVVTGLPVSHLKADINVVKQQLGGQHAFRWKGHDYSILVKDVVVVAQPMGTYKVLDREGLQDQTIGIVDIGFYTTDFILFRKQAIIGGSCTSVSIGCHTICQVVRDNLYRDHGIDLDVWATEEALRTGQVVRMGRTYDVRSYMKDGADRFLTMVRAHMVRLWGNQVEQVFWSGGGSALVQEVLQPLDGQVITDPQTANVRGYLKWGEALQPRSSSVRKSVKKTPDVSEIEPGHSGTPPLSSEGPSDMPPPVASSTARQDVASP